RLAQKKSWQVLQNLQKYNPQLKRALRLAFSKLLATAACLLPSNSAIAWILFSLFVYIQKNKKTDHKKGGSVYEE
ncbi:MAG: hypothetical protein ACI4M3_02240, partial [Acutalibacteraceae bacterium]